MYDLVIIGGGPAGAAAGVYAARKKIKTALIAGEFGGQSIVSADIQNWIGTKSISGFDLAKSLEEHLRAQEGLEILKGAWVEGVEKTSSGFVVKIKGGNALETKTILLASGSSRKKLNVPGEAKLDGKGLAYCSTCDAPLFSGQTVAVVGGGNAGLEAAVDLLPYASKIFLLEYSDKLKGDPLTQEKIKADPKVEIMFQVKTLEILGSAMVEGLKYEDRSTGEAKELKLGGVFVEIGAIPNSGFVKELVKLNDFGEVVVDHKTQASSLPGIWAAGDVSDVLYKQNNISAGDAVKAVLNISEYLNKESSHREYAK